MKQNQISKVCKGNKKKDTPWGVLLFLGGQQGFEEAGPTVSGVKKCPVDTFLGRGRIHILMNAPSMGVGMRILFVVAR